MSLKQVSCFKHEISKYNGILKVSTHNQVGVKPKYVPRGRASPALVTTSGINDASLSITNCLGTPTFPAL